MSRSPGSAGGTRRVLAALWLTTTALAGLALTAPAALAEPGTPGTPDPRQAVTAALPAAPDDPAEPGSGAGTGTGTGMGTGARNTLHPLELSITEVDPQVLQPGDDLTVTVRVRNVGNAPVLEPRVGLSMDRTAFIGRYSLDRWRSAAPTAAVGVELVNRDLATGLAPGEATTVQLVVPARQLPLTNRASTWGARGIAVTGVDLADPARQRLGVTRSFALWFPEQDVNATRVSVLTPLVGPAVEATTDTWVPELDAATADGGRLAQVLDATAEASYVTWLLDPWLLDAADSGGVATRAWRDELLDAMTDREVQLLPYLDADLAAIAHTAHTDLATTAIRRAEAAARSHGLSDASRVRLALPAVDEPDLVTAELAGTTRNLALVVGPGVLPPPVVLTYTPSGRATATAGGTDVTVLVPDERLSQALTTGRVPLAVQVADPATVEDTVLTPAAAAQDLLAELAVITRERPNDSRHVLLTVPRDWTPDVAVAAAQIAALDEAPWVRPEPVSALIGLADPEVDRGTLPTRSADEDEVGGSQIGELAAALERRSSLASMLTDPDSVLGNVELEMLSALSVAWRSDPDGRNGLLGRTRAEGDVLADAVTVSPTTEEGINVLSTSADLSVNVANALEEPITVAVRLRPDDPRLRAEESVEVTIPGLGQQLVSVPVHAVKSADVQVTVEVLTPDGTLLDADTSFLVRVRAEWEGIGTAIIGSVLALGVVLGIARTIRRGRTARRAAPAPDAGPDALSPEQHEEVART